MERSFLGKLSFDKTVLQKQEGMEKHKFKISDLQQKVEQAVIEFMKEDPGLLELKSAHEQAISHRIAYYLEGQFIESEREGLNVDCEYNKREGAEKISKIDLKKYLVKYKLGEFENCRCYKCKKWLNKDYPKPLDKKPIRPDVLVHSRGHNGPVYNLIVIEIKKEKVCPFDKAKLQVLTEVVKDEHEVVKDDQCYGYRLGFFIYFPVPEKNPKFLYFRDGKQCCDCEKGLPWCAANYG